MRSLSLPRSALTPEVTFDPVRGLLELRGECYPENAPAFFAPIHAALEAWFRAAPLDAFEARFDLRYVNSASTKALRRLFGLLHAMAEHGVAVTVAWEHDADDDASAELGADLADRLPLLDYRPLAVPEPFGVPLPGERAPRAAPPAAP